MAKIDEKMLQMVVEMATQGGKMEAQHEAQERDLVNLRAEVQSLQVMIEKRDARISELETLLSQQQSAHPTVVIVFFLRFTRKVISFLAIFVSVFHSIRNSCGGLHRATASRILKSSCSDCKDTKNYCNRQMFWQEFS